MIHRIFNTLSLISALLMACTVILWAWSFWTDPYKSNLSASNAFHIGLYDGRVEFFSDKFGPYHGSIIALTSPERPIERIFAERRGFGDTAGIYYRYFRWANSGAVLWTLSVSLFYPMIVFAVLPLTWTWKGRQRIWQPILALCRALRETDDPPLGMLVAIRLYWWMGVLGAVAYFVAASTILLRLVFRVEPPSLDNLGPLAFCCLAIMAFGTSIHVAHRLSTKPNWMLAYARMVGIILATAWFPILTIPGIICVRRVTKHFAAHCEFAANQSAQHPTEGAL